MYIKIIIIKMLNVLLKRKSLKYSKVKGNSNSNNSKILMLKI